MLEDARKKLVRWFKATTLSTHFLFYKNTVYNNVEPQLWEHLKNICIAETAEIAKVVYF